jgi:hypothetical protein
MVWSENEPERATFKRQGGGKPPQDAPMGED